MENKKKNVSDELFIFFLFIYMFSHIVASILAWLKGRLFFLNVEKIDHILMTQSYGGLPLPELMF